MGYNDVLSKKIFQQTGAYMEIKAADIMNRDVVCVKRSTTLQELVEILFTKRVGGVPVVDDKEELIGIVSKTDLVTYGLECELCEILGNKKENPLLSDLQNFANIQGQEPSSVTVEQIMTTPAIAADPNAPVTDIVRIMLAKKIHRIIIAEGKKVVGIITTMDLLRLLDKR